MHLYALVVGVNDYPVQPLHQCVDDAKKIKSYLESLQTEKLQVHTHALLNEAATKTAIQDGISNFLGQAGDDDVAFFYYSGHGAQEKTAGRFIDEHDGLLECLVAYYEPGQESGYLLADKELRFLFSQLPHHPHLVTVFDACHAGDIVRSAGASNDKQYQIKRMVTKFPARDYQEFLFHDQFSEEQAKTIPLSQLIPFKNSVHLAACSARELSWEDEEGGIFTRYLLTLLASSNNQISYQEIARWANISLKNITEKKQSPTINVQGNGKLTAVSPWLNLSPASSGTEAVYAVHNQEKGWFLTIGSLRGIKPGMAVALNLEGELVNVKVAEVDLDTALLSDPAGQSDKVDPSKRYQALLATTYSPLLVYINNIDGDAGTEAQIRQIVSTQENTVLSDLGEANFFLNIFNEFVYISLPYDQFRPLAKQINLLKGAEKIENELRLQLRYLVKWNHYDTLINPGLGFAELPVKVEVKLENEEEWIDISHASSFDLIPREDRLNNPAMGNPRFQIIQLRITNVSENRLYVGILELQSDLGIAADATDSRTIELEPNQTKLLFDQVDHKAGFVFDTYKEIYNWKRDWTKLRFIYNNYEDLTIAIGQALQPGLETPLVISRDNFRSSSTSKGLMAMNSFNTFEKRSGTFSINIHLINPEYDIISGELQELWDVYTESEELGPFINQLYFEPCQDGFVTKCEPNRVGTDTQSKGFVLTVKKTIGNSLDNLRRKRKFKKARVTMTDKPVIVAEGDSWFLYPFLVKDILDYVMMEFPVLSIAAAGDELENYKADGELLATVAEVRPKFVLISGGGNDIIGPEIEHLLFEGIPAGKTPREYLNEKFDANMANLRELYQYFIAELKKHQSVEQLFIHGYDYIRVDHDEKIVSQGWVNRYMTLKGIGIPEDRERVIRFLVDSFNEILIELAENDPFVTFIDLRGKVQQGQWYDEIHPDDVGYKTLGDRFIEVINAF